MKRIACLTIPLGILLGVTMGATSADAGGRHHVRDSCETRIFQGEDRACFSDGDSYISFNRRLVPDAELLVTEQEAGGFTAGGLDCGCQLRRRYDVICAGNLSSSADLARIIIPRNLAVIGSVERRGRTIMGEIFGGGQQTKLTLRRVALENCAK
jgi:hypothetical protein